MRGFLLLGAPEPVSVVYVLTQAVCVGMTEYAHVRIEAGLERQFAYLPTLVGTNGLVQLSWNPAFGLRTKLHVIRQHDVAEKVHATRMPPQCYFLRM